MKCGNFTQVTHLHEAPDSGNFHDVEPAQLLSMTGEDDIRSCVQNSLDFSLKDSAVNFPFQCAPLPCPLFCLVQTW